MIVARISCPDRPDRLVELERGRRSFGSDFGCDVVLTDDLVQPIQFTLDITPEGVFVEMAEGSSGMFSPNGRNPADLAHGARRRWGPRGRLEIGDLVIRIKGAECRSERSRIMRIMSGVARQSGQITKVSCVVLMSVGVVSVTADLLMRAITPPKDASAAPATPMIGATGFSANLIPTPAERMPNPEPDVDQRTAADVASDLEKLGYTAANVVADGEGWKATFNLVDDAERAELNKVLADLPYRIRPDIYLDSALRIATEMVFRSVSLSETAEIDTLERGKMQLSLAESDPDRKEAVRETLMNDVHGLREIVFVENPTLARLGQLQDEILAVWSGTRPYVAMTDGREIRLGTSLKSGIELVAVKSSDLLVLKVDGKTMEFHLK